MAHFAKVEDGVVIQVIVADSQEWCEENLGGTWVQTSYNTHSGINNREGGEPLRKNFAGIGFEYDGIGFSPAKPFASWIKNEETYQWEAPIPMPNDDIYLWDEPTLSWAKVPLQVSTETPAETPTE